jgi:hypothetical protein
MIEAPFVEWFWAGVDKSGGPDACWEWRRGRSTEGYGVFCIARRQFRSNRAALMLTIGSLPDGDGALHKCDNPPCCNPAHLYPGDVRQNVADRDGRGRGACGARCIPKRLLRGDEHPSRVHPERRPRGEAHGNAKLSDEQVVEMRRLYAAGRITADAIASRYSISKDQLGRIVSGRAWRHVGGPVTLPNTRERVRTRGAAHHQAKLTDEAVRELRSRHRQGAAIRALARAHGLAPATVGAIVRRETWRHVA